ncbi:12475_t:CDS:2 [Dentiscutata heterogama]|uniref:12475_t:CDS:1 n=1 Tax=Dentiscutata heterogama TaxID=1316150 RepID=A0ACA9KNZ2_9GLOM|nr:12475_t:CDS:2 [Dentiscutata heterogama]
MATAHNNDVPDLSGAAADAVLTAAEIAASYVPFVNMVKILVDEIKKIYEDAECNKDICLIMSHRVTIAECAMTQMLAFNQNENYFQKCYLSFKRFEITLKNIKEFTTKVSKLEGYRKFFSASEIKKKFDKLTEEYDTSMKDLNFTMAIASESQRMLEAERVDNSLKNIRETLSELDCDVKGVNNKLDTIVQGLNILRIRQPDNIHTQRVDPSQLYDPPISSICQKFRGSESYPIIRKFYQNYVDVACKSIREEINDEKNDEFKIQLEILRILSQSPYVLKFYGLSNVDCYDVMVFDWAEFGTLKELYNKFDIPWSRKIQIVRDICRGLVSLRTASVFHHDMRCENIFVLQNLDPKIGNFKSSRRLDAKTRNLVHLVPDIIRWMAPELIKKYKDKKYNERKYTFNCEMFSFGMLIWELCYEKLPYENWDIPKISEHVLNCEREKLLTGEFDDPNDKKIQEEFIKIIESTWKHMPYERIGVTELQKVLEQLAATYPIPPGAPILLEDKTLNFDGSLIPPESEGGSLFIPLERGIDLHKKRDHINAWRCFSENADLGDNTAKYWQGYYLCHGYGVVDKDERRAIELFKDAADNDHPDAQFRYAVLLLNNLKNEQSITRKNELCGEILHYFKLAANNKNYDATYHLGDIYLNGKLNVEKNKELGIDYLKLAAENDHKKAIKLLKGENLNY